MSVFHMVFGHDGVRNLTYGHKQWVVTERTKYQIQPDEMSFLRRGSRLSIRDKGRSLVIWEGLRAKLLLLHSERS